MSNRNGWNGPAATAARRHLAWQMRATRLRGHDVTCPRCQLPILPDDKWDVGHVAPISARPDLMWVVSNWRPEHAACNRADGAQLTNQRKRTAPRAGRQWRW